MSISESMFIHPAWIRLRIVEGSTSDDNENFIFVNVSHISSFSTVDSRTVFDSSSKSGQMLKLNLAGNPHPIYAFCTIDEFIKKCSSAASFLSSL